MDLSRVAKRNELKGQKKSEPYWQRLRPGCFVGYVPSVKGGDGAWHARAYDEDAGRYRRRPLGAFFELPGNEKFAAAKTEAEQFAVLVESGGYVLEKLETVSDACRSFATGRPDVASRFRRLVYKDAIGNMKLSKLRRRHVLAWRARLEAMPALVSRSKKGEKRTRVRSPASVNRDMAAFRAALARTLALGAPNSEAAWQEALKPIKNATKRRTLYLDKGQRRALIKHIDSEAEPFVRALCMLPLRPGAVAWLDVGSFDPRTFELTVGKDKAGNDRRFQVPADAADLFASQAAGKQPGEPLFRRANGVRWDRNSWKIPIAEAVVAAKLPAAATAYTLRHSTITDLVIAGLPLLTIAQISGTSVEMIEKHYGHLISHAAVQALSVLSL